MNIDIRRFKGLRFKGIKFKGLRFKSLRFKALSLFIVNCSLFAVLSCNEHYMTYEPQADGTYFKDDSTSFSFGVTPVEITTHTLEIPVYVLGTVPHVDRDFAVEAVADSSTAVEGVQYTIGRTVIPADSVRGYIPVTINRNKLEGSYSEGYVYYQLYLRLKENENFHPTLSSDEQYFKVKFSNAVDRPEWYVDGQKHTEENKKWPTERLGIWHPFKLIKMVEYFHNCKTIVPAIYKEMVELYGENLEHIEAGDTHSYATTFNNYVYKPMYDYFSDSANRELILSMYPDFPFDMPNPF